MFSCSSIGTIKSILGILSIIFSSTLSTSSLNSITQIVSPTLTTSFTSKHFSISFPLTSLGTSESTLSVAISTTKSSTLISSPTSFNQLTIVASSTLSPILGNCRLYFVFVDIMQKYQLYV